jgi:hypothetical protein
VLITRGLSEMTRIGTAYGASPLTFLGLAGVGDLFLTCSSPASRNYTVGYRLGRGEALPDIVRTLGSVAEGVTTAKALRELLAELGTDVNASIAGAVYDILYESACCAAVVARQHADVSVRRQERGRVGDEAARAARTEGAGPARRGGCTRTQAAAEARTVVNALMKSIRVSRRSAYLELATIGSAPPSGTPPRGRVVSHAFSRSDATCQRARHTHIVHLVALPRPSDASSPVPRSGSSCSSYPSHASTMVSPLWTAAAENDVENLRRLLADASVADVEITGARGFHSTV